MVTFVPTILRGYRRRCRKHCQPKCNQNNLHSGLPVLFLDRD